MSCKNNVVLLWVVCLSFEVVMTGCEVVWVNRNVTDSFRVGEDGCTSDSSVCTSSASCQSDGSCLCHKGSPNFRNPTIESSNRSLIYGSTYGCIDNSYPLFGVGKIVGCSFKPFQVIPYSHTEPVTKFSQDSHLAQLVNCLVTQILVKFPDNATEMELQWLNESYVGISVSNNDLFFKWKRSVPVLQGTIVTIHLHCEMTPGSYTIKCLRAKILGTWPAETTSAPTEPTASSTKMKWSPITLTSTSPVTKRTTAIPKSTIRSCSDEKSSSDSTSKIFIVLFSICIAVIIVLGVIVVYQWKDRQRVRSKNSQLREMQKIERKEAGHTGTTSVYDEVVDSGIHNDGVNEDSSSAKENNNERLSDPKYEEPSNYEPLRRNPLQDENEDHHYQSLTTSQKER